MAWTNADGLRVLFNNEQGAVTTGGTHNVATPMRVTTVEFTATDLGTAAAVQDYNTYIPSGARIQKVDVIAETACTSGGSAVLNVGLQRKDFSTELDYDGLVAALALSAINAAGENNELVVGSTGAGALIGTTLANAGVITADYDTAAFTAGRVIVRVHWYMP